MPRPRKKRTVRGEPGAAYFKPRGIPLAELDEVALEMGEFEALRLADAQGLTQDECASRMGVSQPTFNRIIQSARRKIADALINGKAIKIEAPAG